MGRGGSLQTDVLDFPSQLAQGTVKGQGLSLKLQNCVLSLCVEKVCQSECYFLDLGHGKDFQRLLAIKKDLGYDQVWCLGWGWQVTKANAFGGRTLSGNACARPRRQGRTVLTSSLAQQTLLCHLLRTGRCFNLCKYQLISCP